ncbi:hypothetical protein PR048_003196 [Dryococelus australis]|uniref:Uncharacterized protein n=1 Tax=Dryococelus australis TaxID=614101 RepID=A0ABQ9IMB0_9NEOP|nr:hypothetical protein PR048_003196 [Dryococelus australis]
MDFLGNLPFPPPLHSCSAPYPPCFPFIGSQELDVKSHPNLSTEFNARMKGRGKRDIPEKTHRPAAHSGTIPSCEDFNLRKIDYPLTSCGPTIECSSHWATAGSVLDSLPTEFLRPYCWVIYPLNYCGPTIGCSSP